MNISMKKIISFLAAALFACVVLNAQDFSKVEIQTEDGGKTTPAHWVDHKTPYVVSFWFVSRKSLKSGRKRLRSASLPFAQTIAVLFPRPKP